MVRKGSGPLPEGFFKHIYKHGVPQRRSLEITVVYLARYL